MLSRCSGQMPHSLVHRGLEVPGWGQCRSQTGGRTGACETRWSARSVTGDLESLARPPPMAALTDKLDQSLNHRNDVVAAKAGGVRHHRTVNSAVQQALNRTLCMKVVRNNGMGRNADELHFVARRVSLSVAFPFVSSIHSWLGLPFHWHCRCCFGCDEREEAVAGHRQVS